MNSDTTRDAQVTQLQVLLGAALERIKELEQRNAELEAEVERLRARLGVPVHG